MLRGSLRSLELGAADNQWPHAVCGPAPNTREPRPFDPFDSLGSGLPVRARAEDRDCFHGAANMAQLRRLASQLTPGRARDMEDQEIRAFISAQLRRGSLYVRAVKAPPRGNLRFDEDLSPDAAHDHTPSDPPVTDAWVEIRLRSPEGDPVPDEPYIIVPADGKERRGVLDGRGASRHEGLPRGPVRVCFPEIDRGDWRILGQFGEIEGDTQLSVTVIDAANRRPLAGIRVAFTSPAGDTEAHTTNARGKVELDTDSRDPWEAAIEPGAGLT